MPESAPRSENQSVVAKYTALLDLTRAIAAHADVTELCRALAERLRNVVAFDAVGVILADADRGSMRLTFTYSSLEHPFEPGLEVAIDEGPAGLVWRTQEAYDASSPGTEARFPRFAELMRAIGVGSCYLLPLTCSGLRLGALAVGAARERAFEGADRDFLAQVANQVAVAVESALAIGQAREATGQLAAEHDRFRLLLEVNNAVVSKLDLKELFASIAECLRTVVRYDYVGLGFLEGDSGMMRVHALHIPPGWGDVVREGMLVPIESTPSAIAIATRSTFVHGTQRLGEFDGELSRAFHALGIRSGCNVPLAPRGRDVGVLVVLSTEENAFSPEDVELLTRIGGQISIAVENALAYREIAELKDRLAGERLYLEEEIQAEYNFGEIVGHSPALRRILEQIAIVAPTDSAVLIQGETGTGKELVARAIHLRSGRSDRTLVKVNCAAIPGALLESELFGHERGAFTGAVAQRVGRLEIAHKGSLFLDEVGDLPLELQPKLLRALQEREFERLGSSRTMRVDVRFIAATNLDLARLSETMDLLCSYAWPGNVRELENVIERVVILSRGSALTVTPADLGTTAVPPPPASHSSAPERRFAPLRDRERAYIEEVLRHTKGAIAGRGGAAEILGLPPSTLRDKMKKLGIV
jgi:formate hydrogenlyase transcriptional activator